jgi:hypothetical protein
MVNNESESMQKEAMIAQIEVMSRYIPKGTKENREKSQ